MNSTEILQGRIAARAARLADPREPRIGKIKLGRIVHRCKNQDCRRIVPAAVDPCQCGGTAFTKTFPEKTNHYIFFDDAGSVDGKNVPSMGHAVFGPSPLEIPFTFKRPPHECVMLRRETYQGGKLVCCNQFVLAAQTGQFVDTGRADRRDRGEIECNPLACPYSIGGSVTGPDGLTKTVPAGQCGETVTLRLWLPDVPGFENYEHKSGSIDTINNVQAATEDLTRLMRVAGGHIPLRLVLKLKSGSAPFPNDQGKWVKASYFTSIIHFPFSMTDIQKRMKLGTLQADDVTYGLPSGLMRPALPGPTESNYDELIDGPRGSRAALPDVRKTEIGDLEGRAQPVQAQAIDQADENEIGIIQSLWEDWRKDKNNYERGKCRKELIATFALPVDKKRRPKLGGLAKKQANSIRQWLEAKINYDQRMKDSSGKML